MDRNDTASRSFWGPVFLGLPASIFGFSMISPVALEGMPARDIPAWIEKMPPGYEWSWLGWTIYFLIFTGFAFVAIRSILLVFFLFLTFSREKAIRCLDVVESAFLFAAATPIVFVAFIFYSFFILGSFTAGISKISQMNTTDQILTVIALILLLILINTLRKNK